MADNYSFKDAGGNTITHASEEISAGVHASKHIVADASGGVLVGQKPASASLPVVLASDDDLQAKLGIVTETAPGTDTASSGVNGRLQRIAQRLTSLIALLPASLGQTTKTGSLSVSVASDDDLQAKLGIVTETAPGTDTASSGVNGRLQRIAQRLTSLIALLPASLGQTTKTGSLSVSVASDDDLQAKLGIVTETAPGTDTASSGVNGRLQRIAQRLTSLIALLPASLGQKTAAASFPVVLASATPLGAELATTHHNPVTGIGNGTNAAPNGVYATALIFCDGGGAPSDVAYVEISDGTYWQKVNLVDTSNGKTFDTLPMNIGRAYLVAIAGAYYMRVRVASYTSGGAVIKSICHQNAFARPSFQSAMETAHHSSAGSPATGAIVSLNHLYNNLVLMVYSGATGVYSITPQGSFNSGFSYDTTALQAENLADGTIVSAITEDGIYRINVAGFSNFRANLTAISAGVVSVTSVATANGGSGGASGAAGIAELLTPLEAIQAAVEDTSTLTATGALRTGSDGWTTVLVNAGTANVSGTATIPQGARRAIVVIVNDTDVTLTPSLKLLGFGNQCILLATANTVAAGVSQIWTPVAGNTGSSGIVVAMLGELVPGITFGYSFTVTSRTTGTYTVTIYWGS